MGKALVSAGAAVDGDGMVPHSCPQECWPILRRRAEQGLLCAHRPGLHALHNRHWLTLLHPSIAGLLEVLPRLLSALGCCWLRCPACIVISVSACVALFSVFMACYSSADYAKMKIELHLAECCADTQMERC